MPPLKPRGSIVRTVSNRCGSSKGQVVKDGRVHKRKHGLADRHAEGQRDDRDNRKPAILDEHAEFRT
jgi:hypothetical protein